MIILFTEGREVEEVRMIYSYLYGPPYWIERFIVRKEEREPQSPFERCQSFSSFSEALSRDEKDPEEAIFQYLKGSFDGGAQFGKEDGEYIALVLESEMEERMVTFFMTGEANVENLIEALRREGGRFSIPKF